MTQHRVHKVKNSLGVYAAYRYLSANKWLTIPKRLTSHEFYSIIRSANTIIADKIASGESFNIPCRLGCIEVRKFKTYVNITEDNQIRTNLAIDWKETNKLWREDEEAKKKKMFVRFNNKDTFKVHYDRHTAKCHNVYMFKFKANRQLKIKLKNNINEGRLIDAYLI